MKNLKTATLGLGIILLILFVVQNLPLLLRSEPLRLDLAFASYQTPPLMLALLLSSCLALGYLAAFFLGYAERRRLRQTIRDLQRQQARIETELASLRNLPLTAAPARAPAAPAVLQGGDHVA